MVEVPAEPDLGEGPKLRYYRSMQQNASPSTAPVDEINLMELWRILVRRKWLVLATLIFTLLVLVAYLLIKTPEYQASVSIRIGHVAGAGQLEAGEILTARLLAEFGEDVATGIKRETPYLKRVQGMRGVPDGLVLVSRGDRPEDAVEFLERVAERIQGTHSEVFSRNVSLISTRIETLRTERDSLERQYADISTLVERLKADDAVQASLLAMERGRLSESMIRTDAEVLAQQQKLMPPQTEPTLLLNEIVAPARPAAPKATLVLGLGLVLGLVAGVLLVFAAELIERTRRVGRSL